MKLLGNRSAAEHRDDGGADGFRNVVAAVVGVKLDCRSRELLTWALVKVAQPGDHVIALHVLDPDTEKSELLSLVKTFDKVLAAYEGFCNLKQIDLKLKVCRGSPVRKLLAREAKSYNARNLIVGTSTTHHTIRSSVSIAKYCARKNISVIAVDNGKIVFQKEVMISSTRDSHGYDDADSKLTKRKTLFKNASNLVPYGVVHEDLYSDNEKNSWALVPVKTQTMPDKGNGWAKLRRVFLRKHKQHEDASGKKLSVMEWVLKLPMRHSVAPLSPDHKQNMADKDECHSSALDGEKGAIVPLETETSSPPCHSADCFKILSTELEGLSEKYSATCRLFTYQELSSATSNFMPGNLIGKGGSSQVYRGCLPGGLELAVKILKPSEEIVRQFLSEIEIITTLHHKNIISLFGYCIDGNNLLLVYDLLPRGSLEDNLHGARKVGIQFGWEDRFRVALGVAEALDYLHNATAECIIHRDVKSSNILLSDDFEPQLCDFGLATSASIASCHMDGTDIAGTFGYLAPEYFLHGKVNEKIDVYAFGVVLLELLSGRKPIDDRNAKGQESLVVWARPILKGGKVSQLLDPTLVDAYDHHNIIERMVVAATLCVRCAPRLRPEISLVLKILQGDQETITWARRQVNAPEEVDAVDGAQPSSNIQSFINLALLNLEDDSLSSSSNEQIISVEDYLQGRWSRSSSFD